MSEDFLNSEGMMCPRCMKRQNLLTYTFLQFPPNFQEEMVQLYKCKNCHFVFGPNVAIIYKQNTRNAN